MTLDRLPTPVLETDDAVKQGTLAGDQAPTDYNQQSTKLRHGFLAQEVEAVAPQLVHTDPQGYKAIDQQALIPIMLEVIKQQQKDIQALREELNQVKDELDKQ